MQRKIDMPILVITVILCVCLILGLYHVYNQPSDNNYSSIRSQLPPRIPGQDKPLPPPPGMHIPGTISR